MTNFCTLFDSNYILQGLTMYFSLRKHCTNFHLYILAFDDLLKKTLVELNLENVTVISLKDFENDRLLNVKNSRTKGEYCWTCSSSSILFVIQTYNVPSCTYIDADLFFWGDPSCLIDEMGENDVLITAHRYSEKYVYMKEASGKYCVQFVTIKNTEGGLKVLNWWVDKCIDWCYARSENGRFGDQKYLDYWPILFEGIHELIHEGGGLAPWNIDDYIYSDKCVINKLNRKKWPVIFYHFHGLKFFENNTVFLTSYPLKSWVYNFFYTEYIKEAHAVYKILSEQGKKEKIGLFPVKSQYNYFDDLKYIIKRMLKEISKLSLLFVEFLKSISSYKYFQMKSKYREFK